MSSSAVRRTHECPVNHLIKFARIHHVPSQTRDNGVPRKSRHEQAKADTELAHVAKREGSFRRAPERAGSLRFGDAVDEKNGDDEER